MFIILAAQLKKQKMAHDNLPEAPYEDGGAVNFSVVYIIVALVFIAGILIFG